MNFQRPTINQLTGKRANGPILFNYKQEPLTGGGSDESWVDTRLMATQGLLSTCTVLLCNYLSFFSSCFGGGIPCISAYSIQLLVFQFFKLVDIAITV